jgi:hypothetical protein
MNAALPDQEGIGYVTVLNSSDCDWFDFVYIQDCNEFQLRMW